MNRHISTFAALLVMSAALASPASGGNQSMSLKAEWPAPGAIVRLPAIPWPNWKPGHRGIDIAALPESSVVSPVSGRVVWVGIVAQEPSISVLADGLKHTLTPVVSSLTKGDWVDRSQAVGAVDDTKHCGATPCVHWSVRRGTVYIDPRWVAEPRLRRGSPR